MSTLGLIFCVSGITTLVALLLLRYYLIFPKFILSLGLSTIQGVVTLALPSTSHLNRYIWCPIEALLLLAMGMAIWESIWKHLKLNPLLRFWFVFGLALSSASITMYARSRYYIPSQDWYVWFCANRSWFFLWTSIVGFVGFWFSLFKSESSATTRWHLTLCCMLMLAHRFIPDNANWSATNIQYRIIYIALCGGWIWNAIHLNRTLRIISQQPSPIWKPPDGA